MQKFIVANKKPVLAISEDGKTHVDLSGQTIIIATLEEQNIEPLPCALCGEAAESSDLMDLLPYYPPEYGLVQCSNGACRNASWGIKYWNKNQEKRAQNS